MRRWLLALALACQGALAAETDAALQVARPDGRVVAVAPAAHEEWPRETFEARSGDTVRRYTGFDLRTLLQAAGIDAPQGLKGAQLRRVIVLRASDGYTVVFAAAELDPTLGARRVLIAERGDGQPLPEAEGPWRVVVPAETRPTRWLRQLCRVEVLDLP